MTKRKKTPIEDIYHAIILLEKKERTQQKIADELGVHQTKVSKWMDNDKKDKIKNAYKENINGQRKRLRASKYADLVITVYVWCKRTRVTNPEIGINGPII